MYFKQFYLGCLAHASYLIGSDGEAAVVDPQRDVDQYIDEAVARGMAIKYVIETHLHADFVSGHRELAARTGAQVVFGRKADAAIPHLPVKEGDLIPLGRVGLKILETPGHTPESISILVIDREDFPTPQKVLTGDTLFIGDVGRPDLLGARGITAETMAGLLYDSLHEKLLTLDDAVEVYPAHGAGSLCGRNISKETWSTIGEQRRFNYALQPMSREDFVQMMTTDLPEAPGYFSRDVEINRAGAPALKDLPPPPGLSSLEVQDRAAKGSVVLDVRTPAEFGAGHLPGSLNIGLGGQYATWAGTLLSPETPLLIVASDVSQVGEAQMRLSRVGLENVQGYLEGGVLAWHQAALPTASIEQISVNELKGRLDGGPPLQLLDVRRPGEYASGHAPTARSVPLPSLARQLGELDSGSPTAVICASGYRSSIATSLLEGHGFKILYNVVGGTTAWKQAGYAVA